MNNASTRRSLMLVACSAIPMITHGQAKAQAGASIGGIVTEGNGSPIGGVVVRVDRPGSASVQTDSSGNYRLQLQGGQPIGRLSYSHTNFDFAVLANLSGAVPQNISKVMYRPHQPRSMAAVIETLGSYEHLLVALLSAPQAERQQLAEEYRKANWLTYLRGLPTPDGEAGSWLSGRKKDLVSYFQKVVG